LPADQADSVEQVAAFCGVDQPDQAVTDFQFHRVEIEEFFDLLRFLLRGFFLVAGGYLHGFILLARQGHGEQAAAGSQNCQRNLRQSGEHHQPDENAGDRERLGLGKKLAKNFIAEIGLAAGAGDDQTGGEGNDECGNLAHEAVADA
jgi:hypothetical protein